MAYSIMLDAGHGGTKDPGAVYKGRQEKDDNLRLVLAIGEILSGQIFSGKTGVFQRAFLQEFFEQRIHDSPRLSCSRVLSRRLPSVTTGRAVRSGSVW